jgi:hypothetical protein
LAGKKIKTNKEERKKEERRKEKEKIRPLGPRVSRGEVEANTASLEVGLIFLGRGTWPVRK